MRTAIDIETATPGLGGLGATREILLQDHARLRAHLFRTEQLARIFARGDGDMRRLRDATRSLALELSLHVALEEELLAPMLSTLDAWGPVRLRRMREEHARLLASLRRLHSATFRAEDATRLALEVSEVVYDIVAEMVQEELDLLNPDVLRDDVIAIGQATD